MSERWLLFQGWWLHSILGGGVLLLLTWWLMKRCRQPVRRQRLGECGMAAGLLLAVLSLAPPWLTVPVLSSPPAVPTPRSDPVPSTDSIGLAVKNSAVQEVPVPALVVPAVTALDWRRPTVTAMVRPLPDETHYAAEDSTLPPSAEANAAKDPGVEFSWSRLATWICAVYALISLCLLGRWLLGHLALRRIIRSAVAAPLPMTRLFAAMTAAHARPRLLVSSRLRVPISCGLWRPTVIVPVHLCEARHADRLRWIFAHELTHLERRDAWASLLFGLGQVVYFAVPWFWWLRRQVRLCQEYVADAAAAAQSTCVEDYAQFLLSLTATPAAPVPATGVVGNSRPVSEGNHVAADSRGS